MVTRSEGLRDEVRFWDEVLRTHDAQYPDVFAFAFEPLAPLQEHLRELAGTNPWPTDRGPLRILDVGAGPYTTLGKTLPSGRPVELTAIDPLADEYAALLAKYGLRPPLRTKAIAGEDIPDHFAPGSFDIVHARNSLDHAEDPMRCIRNMMTVASSAGAVVLQHRGREGEKQGYRGLHQWNFQLEADPNGARLVVEQPGIPRGRRFVVDDELRAAGHVFSARHAMVTAPGDGEWLLTVFQKKVA